MSLRDKLEIGLDPDAGKRTDNLPDFQKKNPKDKREGELADKIGEQRHKDEPVLVPKEDPRKLP